MVVEGGRWKVEGGRDFESRRLMEGAAKTHLSLKIQLKDTTVAKRTESRIVRHI